MEYLKRFKKDEDFQFSLDNDKINSKYISYCDDDTHIHVAFKDRCGYLIYDFTNEKYLQAVWNGNFAVKINNCYHIVLCKVGNENIFEQFKLISCKNSKYSLQEISSRIVYDVTNEVIAISLTDEENIIVSKNFFKKDAINIYKSFGELKFECKIKDNVFELPKQIFYCKPLSYYSPSLFRGLTIFGSSSSEYTDSFDMTLLESAYIPNTIKEIKDGTFFDCNNLKKVVFEKNSQVERFGYETFCQCLLLEEIKFPESTKKIGGEIFGYCNNLKRIYIPKNVECYGEYDNGVPETIDYSNLSLTSITVDEENQYYNDGNGQNCLIYQNSNVLTKMIYNTIVPKEVEKIAYYSYDMNYFDVWYYYMLSEKNTPSKEETIERFLNAQISNIRFEEGSQLKEIDNAGMTEIYRQTEIILPDTLTKIVGKSSSYIINGETVYYDNCQFKLNDCQRLIIPRDLESAEFKYFFVTADNIENHSQYDISKFKPTIIDYETEDGLCIKDNVIVNCRKWASSVTIPDTITAIADNAFSHCYYIKSITIPEGVTSIGKYAFEYCVQLEEVILPSTITSIGDYAFKQCLSLTNTDMLANTNITVYDSFFNQCIYLEEITIPEGVTKIDYYIFNDNLKILNLPSTLTSLYKYFYIDSYYLEEINYNNTIENWNKLINTVNSSDRNDIVKLKVVVHCTDGDTYIE